MCNELILPRCNSNNLSFLIQYTFIYLCVTVTLIVFLQTALLKRRIDKLKEDLIRKTLETDILTCDLTDKSSSSPNAEESDQDICSGQRVKERRDELWQVSNVSKAFPNKAVIHRVS